VDVTFEVSSDLFTLPEGQATVLAEKLRLFAAGQFRDDVRKLEELGTSRAWLAGTREAADRIEMALVDERSGPVRLVRATGPMRSFRCCASAMWMPLVVQELPAWSRRSMRSPSPAVEACHRCAGGCSRRVLRCREALAGRVALSWRVLDERFPRSSSAWTPEWFSFA
jgi:hypothetical protein